MLSILFIVGVILFFLLFGCAYEFFLCFQNNNFRFINSSDIELENNFKREIDFNKKYSKKEKVLISLVIFLGILCQPLYLALYCLYFITEFCVKFNCFIMN